MRTGSPKIENWFMKLQDLRTSLDLSVSHKEDDIFFHLFVFDLFYFFFLCSSPPIFKETVRDVGMCSTFGKCWWNAQKSIANDMWRTYANVPVKKWPLKWGSSIWLMKILVISFSPFSRFLLFSYSLFLFSSLSLLLIFSFSFPSYCTWRQFSFNGIYSNRSNSLRLGPSSFKSIKSTSSFLLS